MQDQQDSIVEVDLSLLQDRAAPAGAVTMEWIEENVGVDETVDFGSTRYRALADDPASRSYLQGGANVVFRHGGKVILVQAREEPDDDRPFEEATGAAETTPPGPQVLAILGGIGTVVLLTQACLRGQSGRREE